MAKTTRDIINSVAWKACDTFRGTMDSSQYKDYVLTMLFVKYLSDFYREKRELHLQTYQDNADRINRALGREIFKLDEGCTFEYLLQNKEEPNLGEIFNTVLDRIEEDNKAKLDGIFRNVNFNDKVYLGETKERNAILKHLLEDFSDPRLDLRPAQLESHDIIGDSYEYLIAHFASDAGKKGGEFFTPGCVSSLIAKLVSPKEGDTIYDPTCGSGSLLIKAAKEVGSKNFRLFGQEKNGQTHALCRMNMYLHDINDSDIRWGDTIRNPRHLENDVLRKFDVVVANPPFSLDKWGEESAAGDPYKRFRDYGTPPKSKGDYAFILHMVASMNEEGRMGVVLPHGVLFRGAGEGKIRQKLIDENLLDAVIGLPANLFYGTGIPACILIFKRNRTREDVLFIDASKEFVKGKNQNLLNDSQIQKIADAYHNDQEIPKYSHLASREEIIEENGYNLNIPRYVDTFEEEAPIDITATREKIESLESELTEIRTKMDGYLKELGL